MGCNESKQNDAHSEGVTTGSAAGAAQAEPPLVENSPSTDDVPPFMKLLSTPAILKAIYDSLPTVKDQKALSSTSPKFGQLRNEYLGRNRRRINAALKDAADVQAFCHLLANPALGQFDKLWLDLHCELGREFVVDPDSNVHLMYCWFVRSFRGSYCETLRKLSAAFPGVTTLYAYRFGTGPFAESEADLSLSFKNLKVLYVCSLPISLFTGCSSSLTKLDYVMRYAERNAMYRIPSALFDACNNTVEEMHLHAFTDSSFEVCDMNNVAKLTKVRALLCFGGARIANLDMSRMPPTLIDLFHGGEPLI